MDDSRKRFDAILLALIVSKASYLTEVVSTAKTIFLKAEEVRETIK
jgi:hypothetical protein